jgi:hypothetical protein
VLGQLGAFLKNIFVDDCSSGQLEWINIYRRISNIKNLGGSGSLYRKIISPKKFDRKAI